jgi:DNA-binding NarL/FixJ family response regulator
MTAAEQELEALLDEGASALRDGDGARARRAFDAATADSPSGAALEGLGSAAYLELDFPQAREEWEGAYGAYRNEGDKPGAVRLARQVAWLYGAVFDNAAAMNGWMARATTLLEGADDSPERGWVALTRGMFEPDTAVRETSFREALDTARRLGDTDLEFATLAWLGAALVGVDRTEEGMVLLDEALAAVSGNEVEDFLVLEEIFCQLLAACEHAHDVIRADQWIRVGAELAARRSLPAVAAFCNTHYGGVLTAAGRWDEADAALTEAVRLWDLGWRTMRGGALVRLADLRVRQGRFEEAEQLLQGHETDLEAARPLATLLLARGELVLAGDVLERALREVQPASTAAAPLWALLVDVRLAQGDLDSAAEAVERLDACAERHPGAYLRALAALARGRLCLASDTGDASGCLRDALSGFAKAQMPMELARARLELANALTTDRPEVAIAEATAALEAFERLQAARDADAAAAVLRALGVRPPPGPKGMGVLTKRESEVLDLLGHGLSNADISDRLFISRKTVEHHVGRVLAKLGLRNRAEAAAFAARQGPSAAK